MQKALTSDKQVCVLCPSDWTMYSQNNLINM